MSRVEFSPCKSLRVSLEAETLEVTQLTPRYTRVSGPLREYFLDLKTYGPFLHMFGSSLYVGIALTIQEAGAIREKLEPLGLRIESPEPPAPSVKPDALQASAAAGDAPTPDSAILAGVGALGVAS